MTFYEPGMSRSAPLVLVVERLLRLRARERALRLCLILWCGALVLWLMPLGAWSATSLTPQHAALVGMALVVTGGALALLYRTLGRGQLLPEGFGVQDGAGPGISDAWLVGRTLRPGEALLLLRPDGTRLAAAGPVWDVFGCAAEQMVGESLLGAVAQEESGEVMAALLAVLATPEQAAAVEFRHRDAAGAWRTLEAIVENQLSTAGIGALVLSVRDVTRRRQEEAALRDSEARFRTLVENATIGIFRATPEGRLTFANPALIAMLGCASQEEVAERDLLAELTAAHGVEADERELSRADGGLIAARTHRRLIHDVDGRPLSIEGTVEDVTEQRQLSRRLAQAERLSALGELAAGVAHEINNPLATVCGVAELTLRGDLPERAREDLALIEREARRAGEIARTLLRFSRERDVSMERVQLAEVLGEALRLTEPNRARHQIELVRGITPAPEVRADRDQMLQVFINLIQNAVDAMKPQGRGWLRVRLMPDGARVTVEVADSGGGIPDALVERIFDPFFTTKPPGEGTGLGLSICHRIIEDHGGSITVRNHQAGGACFRIELPALAGAMAAEAAETTVPVEETPAAEPRVLVLHPDPMAATMLGDALRLLRYAPHVASSAGESDGTYVASVVHAALEGERGALPPARRIALGDVTTDGWDAVLPAAYGLTALKNALAGDGR